MDKTRRRFLESSIGIAAAAALPRPLLAAKGTQLGNDELLVLSDGNLSLPMSFVFPESIDAGELEEFRKANGIVGPNLEPDCNLTLLRRGERLILFDVGAGSNFMPSAGQLYDEMEQAGIDPASITDVVFTHAHPDHLWGLVDDFDELTFPEANYYMHATEWDYWADDNTINTLPEARQAFAVGAQNRFAYLEERINLFSYGDEVLPGIEAVDTHGHTPGHTSFAVHSGSQSIMVLGDALTHPLVSFQKPKWESGSDQDPQAGRATRLQLLDRLAQDQMQIVGFHMPHPGLGAVERSGDAYRFVAS